MRLPLVFDVFDDDYDGIIDIRNLAPAMRALGLLPTESSIRDDIAELDASGSGKLEMGTFFAFIAKKMRDIEATEVSSKTAFMTLSHGDTKDESAKLVNIQTLVSALTDENGEPLSVAEVDQFIQSLPPHLYAQSGGRELDFAELERFLFATDLNAARKTASAPQRLSDEEGQRK
jgi:Ca2+-binding EF-hand superfamily protein